MTARPVADLDDLMTAGERAITTTDLTRILMEIMASAPPARPDTSSEARYRERVRKQVEEIRARGGVVDIASEFP